MGNFFFVGAMVFRSAVFMVSVNEGCAIIKGSQVPQTQMTQSIRGIPWLLFASVSFLLVPCNARGLCVMGIKIFLRLPNGALVSSSNSSHVPLHFPTSSVFAYMPSSVIYPPLEYRRLLTTLPSRPLAATRPSCVVVVLDSLRSLFSLKRGKHRPGLHVTWIF